MGRGDGGDINFEKIFAMAQLKNCYSFELNETNVIVKFTQKVACQKIDRIHFFLFRSKTFCEIGVRQSLSERVSVPGPT